MIYISAFSMKGINVKLLVEATFKISQTLLLKQIEIKKKSQIGFTALLKL